MSFSDYSSTPANNTTIGAGIYIGPNMARNDVREALQQLAADGKALSNTVASVQPSAKAAEAAADRAEALSLLRGYYSTVAAGAAAVSAPNTFVSDESGKLKVYDHAGAEVFAPVLASSVIPSIFSGQNTFSGTNAGNLTASGTPSTGFGYDVLRFLTSGNLNSAFGTRALMNTTTGAVNSAFGVDALTTNTTGEYNNAFGCKALSNNLTGSRNNAFGQSAMLYSGSGNDNCAFGQNTMINNASGHRNCAYGNSSLQALISGTDNSAFGGNALYYTTGSNNSAFGKDAMFFNTTGEYNNAFGPSALYNNTTASNNSAFGFGALFGNTTGATNAAFGHRAGYGAAGDEATTVDTFCTFLGPFASRSGTVPTATSLTNSVAIGYQAKFTKSNQVVLGHVTVTETVLRGALQCTAYAFVDLPTGAAGMRAFCTNCNSTTFAAAAAGGGTNFVPVYHDGTSWKIG